MRPTALRPPRTPRASVPVNEGEIMPLDWRTKLIHSQATVPEGFQSLATPTYRGSTTLLGSAAQATDHWDQERVLRGDRRVDTARGDRFPGHNPPIVRFNIGLESAVDLIADLQQAFSVIRRNPS